MKSIKASFTYHKKKTPCISDFVAFARAVRGRRFSQRSITQNLSLIDKAEYRGVSIEKVKKHFLELTE